MKVLFTTTPRLKDKYKGHVMAIFDAISEMGHQHTSDFLTKVDLKDFYTLNDDKVPAYYDEILDGLKKAEMVVFEASMHSIGVGMLIREAIEQGKGVVVLHMEDKYPFLLGGMRDDRLVIEEYNPYNVKAVLKDAFDYLNDQVDTRFNFFISPKHQRYLDWIAKVRKVPRAVYLRRLIEEDMKGNKDYS